MISSGPSNGDISAFHKALAPYFEEKRRDMPWRHLSDSATQRFYEVLVSEVMLQQTQVGRVVEKYIEWMSAFPTLQDLKSATFIQVLSSWNGLGYSRRAKYLHAVAHECAGHALPTTISELTIYKGIGPNTAGAILAYYANLPTLFIETNIRTVLFHHFFKAQELIDDKELVTLLARLIDPAHPRIWYWAMMDYGADLKRQVKNNSKSKHYKKQSTFAGSDRQLRSRLLRRLLDGPLAYAEALEITETKQYIVEKLCNEKMIKLHDGMVELS